MEAGIEQLGTWITRQSEVLSLLERKVTDKQEEEVRMIHVAMHFEAENVSQF